jgi:acylphosphatase
MRSSSGAGRGVLPQTMEPSFEKLLVRLAEADVKFVLVGGVAVTLHGYVRLTEDVDILVASDAENIARLLHSLSNYGEGFARELSASDFTDEEGAVRIVEEAESCQVDIFTRMSGLRYDDLIKDAEKFPLRGRVIVYASKAALIRLKESSVRDKDRLDAAALRKLADDPRAFD